MSSRSSSTLEDGEEDVFELDEAEKMAETDPLLPLDAPPTTPTTDRRVRLNVSGMVFVTWESALNRYPKTLLGDPARREAFYCPDRDEYFFDRHRPSFEGIFPFYQRGGKATAAKPNKIERPQNVPVDIFYAEMKFFDIDEDVIKQCLECEWYSLEEDPSADLPTKEPQRSIWLLFDYPESSVAAKVIALISVSIILVSIAVFCVETLPAYAADSVMFTNGTILEKLQHAYQDPLFCVETFCIVWFCFELVIRFYASPNKCNFIKDIMNVFDVVAIAPFFVDLFMIVGGFQLEKGSTTSIFVRILRLFRIFRIMKLSRHVKGLQVLGKCLFESTGSMALLSFFLFLCMTLFGSALYLLESDTNWESIPDTFWYILITMTTVGYGDVYPLSPAGKLIGGVTVVCGIMTLSMPAPEIVTNFCKAWEMSKNVITTQDKTKETKKEKTPLWQRIRGKGKCHRELLGYKSKKWIGELNLDKAKGRLWVTPKHYMFYGETENTKDGQKDKLFEIEANSSLKKYLYIGFPEEDSEFYV